MALDFTGEQVIAEAARISGRRCLLSFSTGKDSIAAALALKESGAFDEIVPWYMYQVPGNLEFIEESLDYYSRVLFDGRRIIRVPHPFIARAMRKAILQPPERLDMILKMDFQTFNATDLADNIADHLGWDLDSTLTALGVRAADSQNRYSSFKKHGMSIAVNRQAKKFYPIVDWNKDRLVDVINRHDVKLPIDYRLFGKTFDGLDLRFLLPVKTHFPRDYERIKFWFPMVDVELFRYEHRQ